MDHQEKEKCKGWGNCGLSHFQAAVIAYFIEMKENMTPGCCCKVNRNTSWFACSIPTMLFPPEKCDRYCCCKKKKKSINKPF